MSMTPNAAESHGCHGEQGAAPQILKPRAPDEQGRPQAWWSDQFQSELDNHPALHKIALAEQAAEIERLKADGKTRS